MSLRDYATLTGLNTEAPASARGDVLSQDAMRRLALDGKPSAPSNRGGPFPATPMVDDPNAVSPTPLLPGQPGSMPLPPNAIVMVEPQRGEARAVAIQNNTAQNITRGYNGNAPLIQVAPGQTVIDAVKCRLLHLSVQTTGTTLNAGPFAQNDVVVEFLY